MHSSINDSDITQKTRDIIHENSKTALFGKNIAAIAASLGPKKFFIQSTVSLASDRKIKWINSHNKEISKYSELPQISLTEDQRETLALKDKPKYNGKHIVIERISLDEETLFIQAKRTDYETIRGLPTLIESNFLIGVIAVIITKDFKTILLQRNDEYKLWSSISGFLEVKDEDQSLNNIFINTATNELVEELTGDSFNNPRDANLIVSSQLTGFSVRGLHSSPDVLPARPYHIDSIVTVQVKNTAEEFCKIYLENNYAPDRKDHCILQSKVVNGVEYVEHEYKIIDLKNLNSISTQLYSDDPGNFLYFPVIITALQSIGINVIKQFEQVTEIAQVELAIRLLKYQHEYNIARDKQKDTKCDYKITQNTPEYEEIVQYLKQEHPELLTLVDHELLKFIHDKSKQDKNASWVNMVNNTTDRCSYRSHQL